MKHLEDDLQSQKLRLEVEKLNADIDKLSSPWYESTDFWKTVLPPFLTTAAVLISLYFTVGKSFIDDEKRKLELQKEQLKLEVMQFEGVKVDVQKQIAVFDSDKQLLQKQIVTLTDTKSKLNKSVALLKNNDKILLKDNKYLRDTYYDDTVFYKNEIRKNYNLEKKYLQKLSENEQEAYVNRVQIARLVIENKFLKSKYTLSSIDSIELKSAKSSASIGINRDRANKYYKLLKDLERKNDENMSLPKSEKELMRRMELYSLGKDD